MRYRNAILKHMAALAELFPGLAGADELAAWRRLRRAESVARRAAERWCNGEISEDAYDVVIGSAVASVRRALGDDASFVVNSDPRGYALKISDERMRKLPACRLTRDMGGYGIIAPDPETLA